MSLLKRCISQELTWEPSRVDEQGAELTALSVSPDSGVVTVAILLRFPLVS